MILLNKTPSALLLWTLLIKNFCEGTHTNISSTQQQLQFKNASGAIFMSEAAVSTNNATAIVSGTIHMQRAFLALLITHLVLVLTWVAHIIYMKGKQDTTLQQRIALALFTRIATLAFSYFVSLSNYDENSFESTKVVSLVSFIFARIHAAVFCETGLLIACGWKITKRTLRSYEKRRIYNLVFLYVFSEVSLQHKEN
mmetsp:Transcript_6561/g.8328  ORF Transcript_6561/g.8328 Transcript_6561/m.8328 type:complete len:198 (-) Transcript_6561:1107-1700(-)